jgi:hypothetical protein
MGEVEQSASSYLETMSPPSKDTEPYLNLPPGYYATLDPDVLILKRPDGSRVALFSRRGFVAETVEHAAWEDYGEEPGDPSHQKSTQQPPHSDPRVRPLRPRPPE